MPWIKSYCQERIFRQVLGILSDGCIKRKYFHQLRETMTRWSTCRGDKDDIVRTTA